MKSLKRLLLLALIIVIYSCTSSSTTQAEGDISFKSQIESAQFSRYIMVGADNSFDFERRVNDSLKKGWQLVGGASAGTHKNQILLLQAMAK